MLDPRAIATLGIGFGAAVSMRLGLWPVTAAPVPERESSVSGGSKRRGHFRELPRQHDGDAEILILLGIL